MTTSGAGVDVVRAEIIRNAMTSAAVEMSKTLVRSAHNPLLYDVQDFGLGIISSEGLLWGEAPGITTFLGALPDTIKTGLEKHGEGGFAEGDVLIVNDPFLTGTHISDVTVYMPVFSSGELVAFAAASAHWADVGGKTPGGFAPDSTDVYQEGIRLTHQKLVAAGERNEDLWQLIEENVRFPSIIRGDLEAQVAACRQGAGRLQAVCEKYGVEAVRESMAFTIRRTEEAIRRQIGRIPDGQYRASVRLDRDGVADAGPTISVCFTVEGDQIRVSFEGTSSAVPTPINEPAIGARADLRSALKGLLSPLDPANEGHFLPFEFDQPPGLIVSPEPPAPCDSYGYVGVALINLAFLALADAIPDRCPAPGYQMLAVYIYRVDPRDGRPFIFIEPIDGGDGARPHADGPTIVFAGDGNVYNTPIEVLETRYPIRCMRYEVLPEVAGAGRYRGGFGVCRDFQVLEPATYLQVVIENTREPLARGLAGGRDGKPSAVVVRPGTRRETTLTDRVSAFGPLAPGDVVSVRSGGGGGWGNPFERDPRAVASEVRDELLSAEEARDVYGIVLEPRDKEPAVDETATRRLRARRG
jgi:N-methylhydantoinase B